MRFHLPSFALGVATGAALVSGRDALRPVAVELGAALLLLRRAGRAVVDRQREHLEDLRAEIEERVRAKRRSEVHPNGNGQNGKAYPSSEAVSS